MQSSGCTNMQIHDTDFLFANYVNKPLSTLRVAIRFLCNITNTRDSVMKSGAVRGFWIS